MFIFYKFISLELKFKNPYDFIYTAKSEKNELYD